MQVAVNEAHIARRKQYGRIGSMVGIGMLGLGFFLSITDRVLTIPGVGEYPALLLAYLLLFPGLLIFNFGRYNAIRWGVSPREDELITAALKGLDNRYHLYHYLPQVSKAEHFMIGPGGILLFEVRQQEGEIQISGDRWSRKSSLGALVRGVAEGSVGNPARDIEANTAAMRAFLASRVGDALANEVEIEGVALFVNPRVKLTIDGDPSVPVLLPRDLKPFVRRTLGPAGTDRLPATELNQLWAAFEE